MKLLAETAHKFLRSLEISFVLLLLLPFSKILAAKEGAENQTVFKASARIVVVNATVTDKSGNFVSDLGVKDFRVFDNGKPQTIQTFALESYGPAESDKGKASDARLGEKEKDELPRPRLISIVIDDLTMNSPADFASMIAAMREFLKNDMLATDQVALLSGSGRIQVPFSDNKQRLLEEVSMIAGKINVGTALRPCRILTDFEAWRISDGLQAFMNPYYKLLVAEAGGCLSGAISESGIYNSTALSESEARFVSNAQESYLRVAASMQNGDSDFRTRKLLYMILRNIRALRHFEGTRMIVLFSDGFISESRTAVPFQLQELVDLALRSGIVLNSISSRGVSSEPDLDINGYDNTLKRQMHEEDGVAQEKPLAQMASETGGLFVHSTNDLYRGIREISRHRSWYYVLSYGMPSQDADGSYHEIKLEVTRPGLQVSHRKGYFTAKEELTFENRKKEDLLDALQGLGNMNEIPMTLAYNYSQEEDSSYTVSFVTNVNIRGLQFIEEDSRRKNLISLVLVAFDENDKYITGLEKMIDFRLLESSYSSLQKRGLTSRVELKLPMGRYKIKAVVREDTQGKIGSVTKAVEIP